MLNTNVVSGRHQAFQAFLRHQGCHQMSCTRARHQPNKHLPPLASTRSEGDSIALDMGRPVLESQDQASIREASQSDTHTSLPLIALRDLATRSQDTITENVRTRWVGALRELREDAVMLGIPRTALPQIPDSPQTELEEYRSIHKRLSGMIASFMSSSL